jgi:ribose 5-phosphate isomerase B
MSDSPKRIVVARAHGGFELAASLNGMLLEAHYEVVNFVDSQPKPDGGWPDFVVPSARAVAHSEVYPGVAVCGTGVVASIASNKVRGVRACLIYESVSAHRDVEDDDMNVICLGGRVVANALSWELRKLLPCATRILGAILSFGCIHLPRARCEQSPSGQTSGRLAARSRTRTGVFCVAGLRGSREGYQMPGTLCWNGVFSICCWKVIARPAN